MANGSLKTTTLTLPATTEELQAALETVSGWSLTEEGRLELTYDSGQPYEEKLIYAPGQTPLTGPTWRLVSYGDPDDPTDVLEGTSITAESRRKKVTSRESPRTGPNSVNVGGSPASSSCTTLLRSRVRSAG